MNTPASGLGIRRPKAVCAADQRSLREKQDGRGQSASTQLSDSRH